MSAPEETTTTPVITTKTKPNEVFETVGCSRCGGGGMMPFAVYGGRCFKCHGSGFIYTKRGAAAKRFFDSLGETTIAGLRVGDRVMDAGNGITVGAAWRRVEGFEDNRVAKAGGAILYTAKDAEKIEAARERGALIEARSNFQGGSVVVYEGTNLLLHGVNHVGVSPERRFRVADPDTWVARMKTAVEYQASLTKAGTPRKGSRWS